jgi:hypothetical protein
MGEIFPFFAPTDCGKPRSFLDNSLAKLGMRLPAVPGFNLRRRRTRQRYR